MNKNSLNHNKVDDRKMSKIHQPAYVKNVKKHFCFLTKQLRLKIS